MFFPEKITQIKSSDKVLEIGPGSTPFDRSDVFLEMKWDDDAIAIAQRGEIVESLETDKEIVFYDGNVFPFKNNEFDYVICSHVIEHVPNVELFISEMLRVANKGYLEYPTIYFEYINNIDVHLNIQKYKNGCFYYLKKSETNIADFEPIRLFLNEGQKKGQLNDLYNFYSKYSIEGFEWDTKFNCEKGESIRDVCEDNFDFIPYKETDIQKTPTNFTLKRIIKKIIKKMLKVIRSLKVVKI